MCVHSLSAVKIPYTLLRDYCGICGQHMAPEVISEHNIAIRYIKRAAPFQGVQAPHPPYSSCVLLIHTRTNAHKRHSCH